MKVVVKRRDFLKFEKTLKIVKLSKLPEDSGVTLSASSEKLSVVGQGFKDEISCQSLQWGSVTVPYAVWKDCFRLIDNIAAFEITIEAEDGLIKFHRYQLKSPNIKVSHVDKVAQAIALNASHVQIITAPFEQKIDYKRLKDSAIWKAVKANMNTLKLQIMKAALPLRDYGIKEGDLAVFIADKLGITDRETFFKVLLEGHWED